MSDLLDAFLDEAADTADFYTDWVRTKLLDPSADDVRFSEHAADFRRASQLVSEAPDPAAALDAVVGVIAHCVEGTVQSLLVALDNGTKVADVGTVALVDSATGESLVGNGAYHELLLEHLRRNRA